MNCPMCEEPVTAEHIADRAQRVGGLGGDRYAHRECMLREVLGGIGHLTNHDYWCRVVHDPDGGMTRRESGLAVDHWVHAHGVEAAAAVGSGTGGGEGINDAPPVDPDPKRYVLDDRRRLASDLADP